MSDSIDQCGSRAKPERQTVVSYYYSRDCSDKLGGHGGMVMAAMDEAVDWAGELDPLVAQIAARFRRVEPRRRVRAYLQGLLAPVERKNGWQLAENAGDCTPDGVQDFLARMRWNADQVRDDLCSYVVAHLGDADAVLVLD